MALFNAPLQTPDHEYNAVSAALAMQQQLRVMHLFWKQSGLPELQIRIGINTAVCLVGNLGCEFRVNYSAIGDGVNTASRLEQLNKRFNTSILIGDSTFNAVKDRIICRWLSNLSVKGKKNAINVYEAMCHKDAATPEIIIMSQLHNSLPMLIESKQYDQARMICNELISIFPDNIAAIELLDRMKDGVGLTPLVL
jgi:adenylate cyclase